MFTVINTAMSGLASYTNGLQTISSNVANMNTAGFLGSQARFSNLFGSGQQGSSGGGVTTLAPALNLNPGATQPTGNPLDVATSGSAFLVVRNADGAITYTRDGRFHLDSKNILVASDGSHVMAMGPAGLTDFDVSALQGSAGKVTENVSFAAGSRLSTDQTTYSSTITIFDSAGGTHNLTLQFAKATGANSYTVSVMDGTTVVSSAPATIDFDSVGQVTAASSTITLNYQPPNGLQAQSVLVSFAGLTSSSFGPAGSNLGGRATADGQATGSVQSFTFDESGKLTFTYSNGAKADGPTLALALLDGATNVEQVSAGRVRAGGVIPIGIAGESFGSILPQQIASSNVDLSEEFGAIILDQRAYQACSEVISTANQMMETLLRMKSGG